MIPGSHLLAGRLQNPLVKERRQAALFDGIQKSRRLQDAFFGMVPACKCFESVDAARMDAKNGLVLESELVIGDRAFQLFECFFGLSAVELRLSIRVLVKCNIVIASGFLGAMQSDGGLAQVFLSGFALLVAEDDPDAGG